MDCSNTVLGICSELELFFPTLNDLLICWFVHSRFFMDFHDFNENVKILQKMKLSPRSGESFVFQLAIGIDLDLVS